MKTIFLVLVFGILSVPVNAKSIVLRALPFSQTALEAHWNGCVNCKEYFLNVIRIGSHEGVVITQISSPFLVTGLDPHGRYKLQVKARMSNGEFQKSNTVIISTLPQLR